MSKELLQKVIDKGSEGYLNEFFQDVSKYYTELEDDLSEYDGDGFSAFESIGEINFSPSEKLVVVTANIARDLTERSSKKAQYEKARKILKKYMRYDAGIFVFSDPAGSFRLSLVYGTPDVTRLVWSNFRRFTYFVSKELTNNTFKKRVGECNFSSLEIIKDAFSVEKVNKEFYIKIAEFFYRLTGKNDYDREMKLPSVAEDDSKAYEEFAVRLIGRSIFCWFLKHKKSAKEIPLIAKEALSVTAVSKHSNYYHSVLEALFFGLMNTPIKDRKSFAVPAAENVPFLNGGLFEPHENDFYKPSLINALRIPDEWFMDFFTVLEQYNFTIDENSTADAEVSVDPEMLGRIFENLLAEVVPETGETARKATGSYYTPRVIVDYMVEQSLKQYLLTKTSLSEDNITTLLSYDDNPQEFDLSEKEAVVRALKEIKIIDPACGSGAFPMGILHRMLLALEKVDVNLEIWKKLYLSTYHPVMRKIIEDKLKKGNEHYIRKLTIIQDSIYGVDIQPIAVEISKLRCFLSLVVDERVFDDEDNRGIEPLPNLEFKFVSANSLIGLPKIASQSAFGITGTVKRLKELREAYLSSFAADKKQIEKEFRATQLKLFRENVAWAVSDDLVKKLTEWDPFSYESNSWFDPEWMFGVSGFDIVIANPPYIRQEQIKELKPELKKQYQCYSGTADIYVYFYERGKQILNGNGTLTYISSNKYFRSGYGEGLRRLLSNDCKICQIIDFGDAPVFEAISYPSVIVLKNTLPQENEVQVFTWQPGHLLEEFASVVRGNCSALLQKELTADGWRLESPAALRLLDKLRQAGKPLGEYVDGRFYRGIITGLNEAFVVDRTTRDRLIAEHPLSAQILAPLLRGQDVKRWHINFGELYLIKIESSENKLHPWSGKPVVEAEKVFAKTYPAIHNHFEEYRQQLIKRQDQGKYFWELRSCKYWEEFEQPKIIWGNMAVEPKFSLAKAGYYVSAPANILVSDSRYLLGVLNSQVTRYLVSQNAAERQGGYLEYKPMYISPLAIPEQPRNEHISDLVNKVISAKSKNSDADVSTLERQIDQMVYELYGLTPEEIAVVEGMK